MSIMPTTTEIEPTNAAQPTHQTEPSEAEAAVSLGDSCRTELDMAIRLDEGCELQQLVCDDDEGRNGTPPVSPTVCKITQTSPTNPNCSKPVVKRHDYKRIPTCDDDGIQVPIQGTLASQTASQTTSQGTSQGSLTSRSMNRIATAPSLASAATQNTRLLFVNEKLSRGPSLMSEHGGTRSARERNERAAGQTAPRAQIKRGNTSIGLTSTGSHSQLSHILHSRSRLPGLESRTVLRNRSRDSDRSCQHHCFLTDVTDVHRMEEALLHLLEDFHSGKLRAFGKDCSMEQMTGIREQQERLARLHFDLGAQGELFRPLSDEGLRAGQENMRSLMGSLQQLSVSIERLHSFSESREGSQQPE